MLKSTERSIENGFQITICIFNQVKIFETSQLIGPENINILNIVFVSFFL